MEKYSVSRIMRMSWDTIQRLKKECVRDIKFYNESSFDFDPASIEAPRHNLSIIKHINPIQHLQRKVVKNKKNKMWDGTTVSMETLELLMAIKKNWEENMPGTARDVYKHWNIISFD